MTAKTGLSRRFDVAVKGLLLEVEGRIHLGLREEPTLGRWGDRTSGGAEEGGAHARAEEGANRSFHDRHTAALWGCEQAQRRSGEVIRLETGMVRSMSEDATPPSKHHGLIVVIDGPAGAGKSTVARRVAQALELPVLDTGAIYRTVALAGDRAGVPWTDGEGLAALASAMPLVFVAASVARSGRQEVWLGDEEVTDAIRTPHVSDGASRVSSLPPVRAALLDLQRKLGTSGCVGEGRDVPGIIIPHEVCLNQLVFSFENDELTGKTIEALQAQKRWFIKEAIWKDRKIVRVSFSSNVKDSDKIDEFADAIIKTWQTIQLQST